MLLRAVERDLGDEVGDRECDLFCHGFLRSRCASQAVNEQPAIDMIGVAGAEVEIVECDTRISRRYAYRGATPDAVEGRGGTSFLEPIDLANLERPDALIYFTDGFAEPPQLAAKVPLLWVISRRGLESSHPSWQKLPGKKLKLT